MATLYLTLGAGGSIWNGRPNINDGAPELYKEFPLSYQTIYDATHLYAVAHNNITDQNAVSSATNFVALAAGRYLDSHGTHKGVIYASNRYENEISSWTHQLSTADAINGIAYGDGQWVGVGSNNSVVYSNNAHDWTTSTGAISNADWTWVIAAYEPTGWRFVAVGSTVTPDPRGPAYPDIETGVIMFSDNGGVTWEKGASGANAKLQSIAYSPELNVYVAVGNTTVDANGATIPTILSVKGR